MTRPSKAPAAPVRVTQDPAQTATLPAPSAHGTDQIEPAKRSQIAAVGIQCAVSLSAVGHSAAQLKHQLSRDGHGLSLNAELIAEKKVWVGAYAHALIDQVPAALRAVDSRNLRFALTALAQIETQLQAVVANMAPSRLAIVVGTSTSGIADNEAPLSAYFQGQRDLDLYQQKQEMGSLAKALQCYLGWRGPSYTISTACSSSAKAFASAQRLLNADLADAVLVAGVDTLSQLTLNGFNSLENLSAGRCAPCGAGRDGINIGEAASMFLLTKSQAPVMLLAAGESMDAWHISAPHPEGRGAKQAMQAALALAQLQPQQIDYLNLHGTATTHNDAMEIAAVRQVFQDHPLQLSSTKHQTGHCLGAAGALEAYICHQVLLDQDWLPAHHSGAIDADLDDQHYVSPASVVPPLRYAMSNSFAFGGSNISLIFGTQHACN